MMKMKRIMMTTRIAMMTMTMRKRMTIISTIDGRDRGPNSPVVLPGVEDEVLEADMETWVQTRAITLETRAGMSPADRVMVPGIMDPWAVMIAGKWAIPETGAGREARMIMEGATAGVA